VVIEEGGTALPIEIKSGQTVISDLFNGIKRWRKMAGAPKHPAALVYGGDCLRQYFLWLTLSR
jgi:hypothetical protein